ncbi:hypothetical protein K474DRAFT_1670368 [Panus rudis PR-1116 ss-1]|nr:hypothetical protein K474DRAFT_1670368 [Panus rudis PR-1116 ss-1]
MSTPTVVDPCTKSQADFPDPDEPGISKKAEEEARKKAKEEARKRAKEVARKKVEEKAREDARRAKEAEKGKGKATAPSEASEAGPSGSWVPGLKTPCYNCRKKDYNCIRGKTERGKPSKSCANCLKSKIQCSRDPTSGPSWKAPRKPVDPDYIDIDEEEDDEGEVPKKKKMTSKAASEGTRGAVGGDLGPQIEQLTAVLKRQVAASERQANALGRILAGQAERQANALERILAGQAEQTKYLNYLAVYTKNIGNTLHEVGEVTLAHARGYLTKEGFRDFDIGEGLPRTLNRGSTGGGKRMRKRKEQQQDEREKDGEGEPDVRDAGGPEAPMEQ